MRSFSSAFFALTALSVATSSGLAQQQGIQLEPGARVRLISPTLQPNQQIVRILSAGSDTVVFRSERDPVTRSLALSDISTVEVSLGEQRRTRTGAVIGLLAGAAIGGIVGYKAGEETCVPTVFGCPLIVSAGESAAVLGLVGGTAGLLIGTTVGWLSKSEKWQRATLKARAAIVPSHGGVVVSISRSF